MTPKDALDLATEAMIESIVTEPIQKQQPTETPCESNDKVCTRRWIDSQSDCC